ncbi:putative Two component transcriptional regulator, LuxR family [Candidatus Sulfotelmatobacter kueseliae]|jgi:DNA-binding NarL/FixJ family response regulator|uniref:Putative Two component transcriptional regulator, LuxR family n=1 Tax=Candidatus Sulfotelmatobacter kueseliae TaxID=2042962 RepID=A0A2U3K1B9_9BACT|nr:putative Two component transcriptional regulator, LuxR family [Candidatus Sulfotelmatobacter kueseliae]
MRPTSPVRSTAVSVLVAGSNQLHCQLLVTALRRRDFRAISCALEKDAMLTTIAENAVDVAVMDCERNMALVRSLHLAHPNMVEVLLLEAADREEVVNAFRSGARGLFSFADSPFRLLCKCIQTVHQGQIWASNEQVGYLIDAVMQVPSLRVVNSRGRNLLTPREQQVVALVADGLSNRGVARELGLSEHTVKKYLFRIFDKLGVSTRVELVLYAVTRGAPRQAEWLSA